MMKSTAVYRFGMTNKLSTCVQSHRTFFCHKIQLSKIERSIYTKMLKESCIVFEKLLALQAQSKARKANSLFYKGLSHGGQESSLPKPEKNSRVRGQVLVYILRLQQICCHLSLLKKAIDRDILQEVFRTEKLVHASDCLKGRSDNALPRDGKDEVDGVCDGFKQMLIQDDEDVNYGFDRDLLLQSYFSSSYESAKIAFLKSKIQNFVVKDKCIVVSQWTSLLGVMLAHLRHLQIKCSMLDGSLKMGDRQLIVDDFNCSSSPTKVLLLSLKAGGLGLNLTGASHIFLLDLHWNPTLEQQAIDRIYRIGQSKDVTIHKFVCEDTIEERILSIQKNKINFAQSLIEGSKVVSNSQLSLADLKIIFSLK